MIVPHGRKWPIDILGGRGEREEQSPQGNGAFTGCKTAVAKCWERAQVQRRPSLARWPFIEFKAKFAEGWAKDRRDERNYFEGFWSFIVR